MNILNDVEVCAKKFKYRFSPQQQWAFLAVLIVGLIAHGYIIFNRISYHDNTACLFSLGATYELGRWGLGIIYDLQIFTTRTFSVPVFNGILSMLLIGMSASELVKIFDIKTKSAAAIIGAIMIAYPVVPSIFSFMFTSWPYFLGLLLSVKAAAIIVNANDIKGIIGSALVLSVSLGLYQAFFAVTITIVLIKLLQDVLTGKIVTVKDYAKNGFSYLVMLAAGLGIWAVISAAFRKIKGIDTMEYKGMGEGYDIVKFPARLALCVQEFFAGSYAGVNGLRYLRLLTEVIILMTVIHILAQLFKKNVNIGVKISTLIGVILLPIGMNVMYILSTSDEYFVDSLMVYGTVFVFILPLILMETFTEDASGLIKNTELMQLAFILIMMISYVYLDNAAYMKADIAERQATSYFTQLAANIKSTQRFTDEMDIVFVDFDKNEDDTFVRVDDNEELDAVKIEKFPVYSDLVTYGSAIEFMQEHCGFGNDRVSMDDGSMSSNSVVQAMPTYPDYGSISVVDDKIVVKFGK